MSALTSRALAPLLGALSAACLLACTAACVVPVHAPELELASLARSVAAPHAELGVTLEWAEGSELCTWGDAAEAYAVRALRTSGLFRRVAQEERGLPLEARLVLRARQGHGYLPLFPLISFWHEELELEFLLVDASGRPVFAHRGTRRWTMGGSILLPYIGEKVDPGGAELHALVREALAAAQKAGALGGGAP